MILDKQKYRVSIVPCENYETETVQSAMRELLAPLGGLDFVSPGMTIAIKANLVTGAEEGRAVTTHPELVAALCEMLCEKGAKVIVGDSPGGLFTPGILQSAYRNAGYTRIEQTGARLNLDTSVRKAVFPDAVSAKAFDYTGWLDQADVIIDFAKLKTHAMLRMTCCTKNLFGVVPGTTKPEYHMRFPEPEAFANMLVDLNEYFRPKIRLAIVDAVDGMEGNGPTSGTPRHIGALVASEVTYAADLVCASMIGMKRSEILYLEEAWKRGLAPGSLEEIEFNGGRPEQFAVPDFKRNTLDRSISFGAKGAAGKMTAAFLKLALSSGPKVTRKECTGCGKCSRTCPAHAIRMMEGKPSVDRKKCIGCFCCQEFCPTGAMKVHHTFLAKALASLGRSQKSTEGTGGSRKV